MTLKWRTFVNQNTWKTEYNLGENEFDMYDQNLQKCIFETLWINEKKTKLIRKTCKRYGFISYEGKHKLWINAWKGVQPH